MWRDRLPVSLTRLVTPQAIRDYAEGLGWQRVEGVNDKIAVYKDPASPLRQLIVPLDEALDDYGDRTAEAIHRLSESEGRSAPEILDHLLLPPSDILFFREIGAHGDDLLIPLDRATRMIDGV